MISKIIEKITKNILSEKLDFDSILDYFQRLLELLEQQLKNK